jgi:hypothetical protein
VLIFFYTSVWWNEKYHELFYMHDNGNEKLRDMRVDYYNMWLPESAKVDSTLS